jgi:hypothetical protein
MTEGEPGLFGSLATSMGQMSNPFEVLGHAYTDSLDRQV